MKDFKDMQFKITRDTDRGLHHYACGRQNMQLNTYDWLYDVPGNDEDTDLVEVQFKNTRKGYYHNVNHIDLHKGDIVAFLRVYLRSVDMMKKTPAEDLADDYMRFYNAWTGKTMTREEAIRDIKDHPVYALDQQLDMFKQSYGTSELREWLHDIVSFQNETGELDRRDLARLERLHYVTDIYLKAVKAPAKK